MLLLSVVLYIALAVGAHGKVRRQFQQLGLTVDIWAHPSRAWAAAMSSGLCLLAAAYLLQGRKTHLALGANPSKVNGDAGQAVAGE